MELAFKPDMLTVNNQRRSFSLYEVNINFKIIEIRVVDNLFQKHLSYVRMTYG